MAVPTLADLTSLVAFPISRDALGAIKKLKMGPMAVTALNDEADATYIQVLSKFCRAIATIEFYASYKPLVRKEANEQLINRIAKYFPQATYSIDIAYTGTRNYNFSWAYEKNLNAIALQLPEEVIRLLLTKTKLPSTVKALSLTGDGCFKQYIDCADFIAFTSNCYDLRDLVFNCVSFYPKAINAVMDTVTNLRLQDRMDFGLTDVYTEGVWQSPINLAELRAFQSNSIDHWMFQNVRMPKLQELDIGWFTSFCDTSTATFKSILTEFFNEATNLQKVRCPFNHRFIDLLSLIPNRLTSLILLITVRFDNGKSMIYAFSPKLFIHCRNLRFVSLKFEPKSGVSIPQLPELAWSIIRYCHHLSALYFCSDTQHKHSQPLPDTRYLILVTAPYISDGFSKIYVQENGVLSQGKY
ncbi:hypothetical protein TRICI_002495 [Trichomonascus ciferrii]|uniref:Uncharacterized protein n=1 Tax=Trichomonascus ciferrii TaxID=44093 RepID=A0A642V5S3_9ASCO|nr:hypothetical protein TRICI_002495 [Trichomonascus ciferrii]